MEERHWAGSATLRLWEAREISGFVQLEIAAPGGDGAPWTGLFVAADRQEVAIADGPAELIVPDAFIARATVVAPKLGLFLLTGLFPPTPEWEAKLEDSEGVLERPELFEREGYLEARGPKRITLRNWEPVNELPPFPPGTRLLIDYRPVREVLVPFDWFLAAGVSFAEMGVRVAVVADHPVAFGVSRQTLLTAGLEDGTTSAVFKDYEEARTWLLSE
ncbi:MAG: hypothetical protein ABI577_13380 [bacterium]